MSKDPLLYADCDFLLALLKPKDWLKNKAKRLLKLRKDKIFVSETTILEMMFFCKKNKIDVIRYMASLCSCSLFKIDDKELYLEAAYFMKEYELEPTDSIHAAYSITKNMPIISSDACYDKIEKIEKIDLKIVE